MRRALPRPTTLISVPIILRTPYFHLPITVSLLPSPTPSLLIPRIAAKLVLPHDQIRDDCHPNIISLVKKEKWFQVGECAIEVQKQTMMALSEGAKAGESGASVFVYTGDCAVTVDGTAGDAFWRETLGAVESERRKESSARESELDIERVVAE